MNKTFRRRKATEPVEVDITSLLDILVILLVFLLMNYNRLSSIIYSTIQSKKALILIFSHSR